jgi:hypothetical protein
MGNATILFPGLERKKKAPKNDSEGKAKSNTVEGTSPSHRQAVTLHKTLRHLSISDAVQLLMVLISTTSDVS